LKIITVKKEHDLKQGIESGFDPYALRDRNGDGEYFLRNLIRLVYRLGLLGFAHGELIGAIVVHRHFDRCDHWAVEPTLARNLNQLQELRDTTLGHEFGEGYPEYKWVESFINDIEVLYYHYYKHIVDNEYEHTETTDVRETEVIHLYKRVWEKMERPDLLKKFESWQKAGQEFTAVETPYKYLVKHISRDQLPRKLKVWEKAVSDFKQQTAITFETVLAIRAAGLNLVKLLYEKTNWRVRGGDLDRLAPLPLNRLYRDVAQDEQKSKWLFGAAGTTYYSDENLWGPARHGC